MPKKIEPKNLKRTAKSEMSKAEKYAGVIPSIVGRRRILVKGKNDYVYVDDLKAVAALKERIGDDFIRDLGIVK